MVFLYLFFPAYNNHSIPSCKITRKKEKTAQWFFIFILRLIARRFVSKTKADNQENGDLQDYPVRVKLHLFV